MISEGDKIELEDEIRDLAAEADVSSKKFLDDFIKIIAREVAIEDITPKLVADFIGLRKMLDGLNPEDRREFGEWLERASHN